MRKPLLIHVYNIVFVLGLFIFSPWFFYQMLRYGKYREGLWQRLGFFSQDFIHSVKDKKTIWIHAVSVGEVLAAEPLLERIKSDFPQHTLLLTTTTNTGYHLAEEKIDFHDLLIYFPLDIYSVVRKSFAITAPNILILMEAELWPNALTVASEMEIPVIVLNGRMSENSFRNYRKALFFFKSILSEVKLWAMQTKIDCQRVKNLGVSDEKIVMMGNLKYEKAIRNATEIATQESEIRAKFPFPKDSFLIIGGSTHPQEEDLLLDLYCELIKKHNNIQLLVAPRHVERRSEVKQLLETRGLKFILRSEFKDIEALDLGKYQVVVLDTIGELSFVYFLANLVIIGGSFIPHGGQNPLEASVLGKPVIFGPYMENFPEITSFILKSGGAFQVADHSELVAKVQELIQSPELCRCMGEQGRNAIISNKGAVDKSMKFVKNMIK